MNRRDALKSATALVGGALFAASGVLAACSTTRDAGTTSGGLSVAEQDLLVEIADTLLPTTTASPGAKAAGVGPTINLLLTDCYEEAAQRRVRRGLESFRAACRESQGAEFAALDRATREKLLREIDAESKSVRQADTKSPQSGEEHWFVLVRELATRAYFTSELGVTQALRYVPSPGPYNGCVPLQPGQPAWA